MSELSESYISSNFGALFIGLLVSAVLFGITNLQVYFYITTYPKDWVVNKIAVYCLWLFDGTHLALDSHVVYYYVISNYGNELALLDLVWSYKVAEILNLLVICLVHTLYVIRLIRINAGERKYVPWIGAFLLLTVYSLGGYETYAFFSVTTIPEALKKIGFTVYVVLIPIMVVDILIASALTFVLAKRRTGFARTDSAVTILMAFIINTGLFTSLGLLATVIVYAVMPNSLIFAGIEFIHANLYVNSYIALLNARRFFRARASSKGTSFRDPQGSHDPPSIVIPRLAHAHGARLSPGSVTPLRSWNDSLSPMEFGTKSTSPFHSRSDLATVSVNSGLYDADAAEIAVAL